MANERLYQFPSKSSPTPSDIIYVGDASNAFNEVQSTIAQIVAAYPNLSSIALLTFGANTYGYYNNSSVLTAGTITSLAVSLLADSSTSSMQSTLGLVIGTNVQAHSAALDSIAALTTVANNLIYTTGSNTYAVISPTASAVLVTSAGNVPSLSTVLPAGLTTTDPTTAQGLATKNYVDSVAQGLNILPACTVATTTALTVTYNNGASGVGATLTNAGAQVALSIDGVSLSVNDVVLVKNQASALQNGIYTVTNIGSGSTNWVMTRATYYNSSLQINPGDMTLIDKGTVNTATSWVETATVVTVGTDSISFSQFGAAFPISVANGGTSATSFTAYAVICGGTTSTGALQSIASVGTANQILTSNGAGTLPTMQSMNSSINGVTMAHKTGSGSATDYTTSSASYVDVDGTNLAYTVTVPVGYKIQIIADMGGYNTTVNNGVIVAITDGTTVLSENEVVSDNTTTPQSKALGLNAVFTGDGASHTFKLRFKADGGGTAHLFNGSTTFSPQMSFLMMPSA